MRGLGLYRPASVKFDFLYEFSAKLISLIKLEYLRVFVAEAETQALKKEAEQVGRLWRMRLTNQSRYTARSAATAVQGVLEGPPPWED